MDGLKGNQSGNCLMVFFTQKGVGKTGVKEIHSQEVVMGFQG